MSISDTFGLRRVGLFLYNYAQVLLAMILAFCALFFFFGAESFRRDLWKSHPELFIDQQQVTIERVIDGDELQLVDANGYSARFRMLGIKTFDSTANDPMDSQIGKTCFSYLESTALGRKAQIQLSEKVLDNKGRLLGSIYLLNEEGEPDKQSLAEILLQRGYAVVYTRYDFPDMDKYLNIQAEAKIVKQGLWGNARLSERVEILMQQWRKEREEND